MSLRSVRLIDETLGLIFVHITKTAGVSVEKAFEAPTHDHRTAEEYRQILGDRFDDFFSFAIVRNPWDKMVSQYRFNAHKWVGPDVSFDEYIRYFYAGGRVSRYSPFHLPYLVDGEGNVIVDYLGRFEALEETMRYVYEQLNLPYRPLPHENRSVRDDYRAYYDDDTAEIVSKLFAEEIALFDYRFDA
jgi:hypothetical protein